MGRAIALEMAQKGCNIAVADVNINAAEETAADIRKLGVQAKAYKVDVTKSEEIIKLRDFLKTDLGPVDILVSNQLGKRFFDNNGDTELWFSVLNGTNVLNTHGCCS